jgi:hypothetical protein
MFWGSKKATARPADIATHASLVQAQAEDDHDHSRQLAALDAEIAIAGERCASLRRMLDDVSAQRDQLQQQRTALGFAYDQRRSDREQQLLASADPSIDHFLDELSALQAGLRGRVRRYSVSQGLDRESGRRLPTVETTNLDAIRVVTDAILRARDAATHLKLTTVPDVGVRLEALRRQIPTVDQIEAESQGAVSS